VIENPVSRERITFLETPRETDGELLRFEYVVPPRWSVPELPPPFLGSREAPPRLTILMQRLTQERLTRNRPAAADLTVSPWMALTILLRRRPSEYGFLGRVIIQEEFTHLLTGLLPISRLISVSCPTFTCSPT
jgi:hypothetical protein